MSKLTIDKLAEYLESAWDVGGVLDGIRQGRFVPAEGTAFIATLADAQLGDDEMIPKRLLSLLWYLPSFLEWQCKRVDEKSHNLAEYKKFVTQVMNTMEIVLGIP